MSNWITTAHDLQKESISFAIVTVIHAHGSTPRASGTKMMVTESGRLYGTIGGGKLEERAIQRALECLKTETNEVCEVTPDSDNNQACGSRTTLYIEVIGLAPKLFIFGAGHVGQAVANITAGTPFSVTLIDGREEWLHKAPEHVQLSSKSEDIIETTRWNTNCYVVIMTHSHEEDLRILQLLINKKTKYLGVIGSRGKWALFQEKLKDQHVPAEAIESVTCPIGLKIGGRSPHEVAISLMGELLSIHYGKNV